MPVTIGLGLSAATTIYGAIKQNQANKAAKANLANRPVYTPLPEDGSELNLAQSQANQGLGAGATQALLNNSQNQSAATNNAILMGGGDANAIAGAAAGQQNSLNNLAVASDTARQQHVNSLLGIYNQYANQRQANADKQFQFNQYAPWADRQQLYSQQNQAAQQLFTSGISSLGKGLMSFGSGNGGTGNIGGGNGGYNWNGGDDNNYGGWAASGQSAPISPLPGIGGSFSPQTPVPGTTPYYPVPGI